MLWCRLHAFSPHYLESTLHPFGVELTADRIGKKFSSVTCPTEIISSDLKDSSIIEINEEEDVDIINTEQFIPKKKVVEEEKRNLSENGVIVPPSDSALYIQDTCQRIGVKFEPTELEPGVCGNASEDMVFAGLTAALYPDQPSLILASNGAECIMISKKFFLEKCSEEALRNINKIESPFPNDEDLQKRLQEYVNWTSHRKQIYNSLVKDIHCQKAKRMQRLSGQLLSFRPV
ncbi:Hypothetical predicted protein [Mytilus galloprovincialis]|uniref:Uncharacterized protein n=2 Tax=Mytilus galloprovincialis TaxID=29158 RepID=A0A8B6G332_MYTGA|nr:Hypothetical predicted protein [Mytilus galloprovincialis]